MDVSALTRYRPVLRAQVRRFQLDRRLQRRIDSSDLIQDTMERAVRRFDQFRGKTDVEVLAWLQEILRTVALNAVAREEADRRDFHREVPFDHLFSESSVRVASLLVADSPAPEDKAERRELVVRVAEALEQLPEGQRDAVTLWVFHGCSAGEVADILGKTERAAAGLIRRGVAALRGKFARPPE